MNRPEHHFRARLAVLLTGGALIAALFPMAGSVLAIAPATVTPATGGSAISLDTSSTSPGTNTYTTTLTGPVITEATAGTFSTGTIVLAAPTGFEFSTGSGSVGKTGDCTISAISMLAGSATATILTQSTSTACVITFSGLKVHPTGTAPTSGNISATTSSATGLPGGSYGALASVAGAPILTFTRQPSSSAAGGVAFAQQPQVTSADRFGNLRSGDIVTLAINTNTAPGTLTCATVTTAVSTGIATFSGCSIDKVGSYTLRATTPGQAGTVPVSSSIAITVGAASRLIFYQRPTLAVVNVAFPAQPIVAVADLGGNLMPSGSGSTYVSLAITSGTGSLLCTVGPTSVSTVATYIGVMASFSGCRINTAGIGDVITATSTGGSLGSLTPATATLDVENQLVFIASPTSTIGGAMFTPQPVVTVQANSAIATNDSTTVVTLSIASGSGAAGAILSCTGGLSKTVVAGVATFVGCSIDKLSPSGVPYQLVASTTTGLSAVYSTSFAVTVGPAIQVAFTTQPVNANVAQVFPTSPVVAIKDAGSNTITSGTDSYRSVTLAIGSNPGGGTLTCSSGLTLAAVAGVATFTGCSIDRMGVGYTLIATSSGLTFATSSVFNVTAPAAQITLTPSASVITWAKPVVLTIHFVTLGSLRPFTLQVTRDLVTWQTVPTTTTLTTDTYGNATFSYRPATNLWYRVSYAGATDLSAAFSNVPRVVVRQIALLRPTSSGAVRTVARNTSVTFTTTVRPVRADLAPARVTFVFYRLVNGRWTLFAKRDVFINSLGLARYTWKFSTSGAWYVRSIVNPTIANANSVWSQIERYNVN